MYSFQELKKAAKKQLDGKDIKVAVAGNCATQFFSVAIQGYSKLSGLNVTVFDADYNQIETELFHPDSNLYQFQPDHIVLWLSSEKLYEDFLSLDKNKKKTFAKDWFSTLERYWLTVRKHSNANVIQLNFTEIDDKVLGSYSSQTDITFIYQIRELNYLLQKNAAQYPNLFLVDLLSVQMQIGREKLYQATLYYNAKMPVSLTALPYVAKAVSDVLNALSGHIKKCIILDLDNTIWGGVIGDDGLANIEIGELGKGAVFTAFQKWLKELKESGIILAVCSKNEEETAKEPFEKSEDMILRLEDISVFVANWNDKATNIKMIQETLNIGLDSMIFLDDNPFERNLVRQMLPEIEVPELPEDPAGYLEYLWSCNYFETASYTETSEDRTKLYQEEYQRNLVKADYESLDDYLKGLEMTGAVHPFDELHYSRIAQLTQRSNQFNLRTIRYTEGDIKRIANDSDYLTFYYTLQDKFGNHGLVSVLILKKQEDHSLFIDTWLMSCRVLKRGMEEFVMNRLVESVKKEGFTQILAEYIPTKKNGMVKELYSKMGFSETTEFHYRLSVEDYKSQPTYITITTDDI